MDQNSTGGYERTDAYERSDASVKPVMIFTLALTAVLVAVLFAMSAFYDWLDRAETAVDAPPHPMATASEPPAPRLQTTTADDRIAQLAREQEQLDEYAWIAKPSGNRPGV